MTAVLFSIRLAYLAFDQTKEYNILYRRETFQSLTTRRRLDRPRYSLVVHARKLCMTVNKLIEIDRAIYQNRSLDTNVRIELGSKCETIL